MQGLGLDVEIVDGQPDALKAGTEVNFSLTFSTSAQCCTGMGFMALARIAVTMRTGCFRGQI